MLNSVEQMLFESTNAKFALKINVMTTKKNTQTNQQIPLITVSQQGNARIKPNAFLVFTYMTDDYETLIVTRKNNKNVVMMSEEMYNNLMENVHIVSSKANFERLMKSKQQLEAGNFSQHELAEVDDE